jgi:hypothetical protein
MVLPLLILAAILLTIVLLDSLYAGVSFHLHVSKTRAYVAALCEALTLCACFFAGLRLRREGRRDAC